MHFTTHKANDQVQVLKHGIKHKSQFVMIFFSYQVHVLKKIKDRMTSKANHINNQILQLFVESI
jgi:hypothetical protein